MSDTTTVRDRWRGFFATILTGPGDLADLAADAAVRAMIAGAGRDEAVAAGMRAARETPSRPAPARPRPTDPATTTATAASSGRSRPSQPAPAPPAGPTMTPDTRHWPADAAVVLLVERRSESLDGQFFQVLSCRLMRLAAGKPTGSPITAELRGRSIIGQVVKGDVVATPPGEAGRTRIVKVLQNLTTDSTIEAKGRPFRRTRTVRRTLRIIGGVLGVLLMLIVLALICATAYFVLSGAQLPFS